MLKSKSFNGTLLLEIAYLTGTGKFTTDKAGIFSIWHKAPLLKCTPVDQYRPHIFNDLTKQELPLTPSYIGKRTSGFDNGRIELFTFTAESGTYTLQLAEGSSLTGLQSAVANVIPQNQNADLSKHYIQVRETQSQLLTLLAIPMTLLGAAGILGGFVLGLLADQVFKVS